MQTHPSCYGGIFPDLSPVRFNTLLKGKAFDVFVERRGFGVSDRTFTVNLPAWEQCTECASYPRCYELSMAKLHLHDAVQEYGMARAV